MLEWRRKYGTERGLERAKRNVMALAERRESLRPVNMATKQRMISLQAQSDYQGMSGDSLILRRDRFFWTQNILEGRATKETGLKTDKKIFD
jgi:hypothetical protein